MRLSKNQFLAVLMLLFIGVGVNAQDKMDEYPYPDIRTEEYKDFVKDKNHEQHDKFLDRKYTHPAAPKHQTEIGIDLGLLMISGDVKAKPGFGIGGHIRKALGYTFSLRGSIMAGTTTGRNWQGSVGWNRGSGQGLQNRNLALSGGQIYERYNENMRVPDYTSANPDVASDLVFYNYQTKIREAVISGLVNLNNIKFHKRRNTAALYGYFGLGGVMYQARMDQLDGNGNEYNYNFTVQDYNDYENRADMIDALDNLWDGEYESMAEKHFDDYWVLGIVGDREDEWSYRPTAHVGLGVNFKITNKLNFGIDTKVTYTNDDLLDGQRYGEEGSISRDYDTYTFTAANLNLNLGGKNSVEPLWWMSPLDYAYQELDNAPCCDDIELPNLSDDDNDGVPNIFDVEPDSREDCPVDTKGRMLDSDGDGILDCDDCQPYTPRHLIDQIDDCGAAFEDNAFDCDDLKNCDVQIGPAPCDDSMLPNVLFGLGSTKINPDFEGQLSGVANYLRNNPDTRLCVVGHTDNRGDQATNNCLSWKRANAVVEHLVNVHGVPRSRLAIQYSGENAPIVGGLSDTGGRKGIDAQHALNRRVDFKCCMEGQFDMPNPCK